jgi:hypothetical protein
MNNATARRLGAVVSAVLLAACSNTPTPSAPSSATPTAVSGTITGFGSVIVDGVAYEDTAATVSDDTDPAKPVAAALTDLSLGEHVDCTLDGQGRLAHVSISSALVGPIDAGSLNPNDAGSNNSVADSFTVLGQVVTFTPSGTGATVFQGVADATGLTDGQVVVVHGTTAADGSISATRVDVLPAGAQAVYRVSGAVKNTSISASTFQLNALTISYSAASIVPASATIQDGERVVVFATQAPTGTAPTLTLVAKAIRVRNAAPTGEVVRVGGPVTAVTPVAGQAIPNFTVNGQQVDASKAALAGSATAADLVVGAQVRVVGTLSSGVLLAQNVAILPAATAHEVHLVGQVSSYVSVSSFQVRGTPVDATSATFLNGTAAQLADGVFVEVEGHLSSASVVADKVTLLQPPQGVAVTLAGTVSGYDPTVAAPQPFTLHGFKMQLDATATFAGGTAADFKNGVFVQVTGTFTGLVLDVTAVTFPATDQTSLLFLRGVVSGLASTGGTATSFTLNKVTVTVTSTTTVVNGPLADGQPVVVVAVPGATADTVTAQRIVVMPSHGMAGGTASPGYLFGPISAFTSVASFTVDHQTVDASKATFLPAGASAADLAVGKVVAVQGTVTNGVVVATQVAFLRR